LKCSKPPWHVSLNPEHELGLRSSADIEELIAHMKPDHRMRNYLKGTAGD